MIVTPEFHDFIEDGFELSLRLLSRKLVGEGTALILRPTHNRHRERKSRSLVEHDRLQRSGVVPHRLDFGMMN